MADVWAQFPDAAQSAQADAWADFPDADQPPADVAPDGRTRAQLEQELAANQAEGERLGGKARIWKAAAEGARELFMPFAKMTKGIQSLPAMAADALVPGQPFQQSAEKYFGDRSYFAPRDDAERFAGKVYEGIGGAMFGGQAGNVLKAVAPIGSAASKIGGVMQNLQGAASATLGGVIGSEIAREAGGGPMAQTLAGMAGAMAPSATSTLVQRGAKRLVPDASPEAKTLMAKGVDLTMGQQRPGKAVSQLEDAIQDWPLIGPSVKAAKESAQAQAREAFILDAAAPGVKIKPSGDLQKTLSAVGDSFKPAYDKVNGFPLVLQKGQPVIVKTGANVPLKSEIAKAVADKGVLASDSTRKMAASFLGDQLSKPIKNSQDLLSVRSSLRSELRSLTPSNNDERALHKILSNAESKITEALESQLPPKLLKELKAVDSQYSKYKTAVDTMAAAKDRPEGFTFGQASTAAATSAKKALGKDAYAKGAGNMREVPAAAQAVFKQSPPTGARLVSHIVGAPMLAPVAFGAVSKTGRNLRTFQPGPYRPRPAAFSSFLAQRPWEQR